MDNYTNPLQHYTPELTGVEKNMPTGHYRPTGPELEAAIEASLKPRPGFFSIQSASGWLQQSKHTAIPKKLFGDLWNQGEVCILFADTNVGKSILAVQIADSISSGRPISIFDMEAEQQPVLYFDFELSEKQFENRYSNNFEQHYHFTPGFLRAVINTDTDLVTGADVNLDDYLVQSLERAIVQHSVRVVIIDNLTYLRTDTERAKDALPLMKKLKDLKNRYGLSLLILAHTPKRDLTRPLTHNDLSGSKMLINFCDSAFALGQSARDKNVRYLKQIKTRNSEIKYSTDNVCLFTVTKPHNFLQFEYLGNGYEKAQLKELDEKERNQRIELCKQLQAQGLSQRQIAEQVGVPLTTVNRYLAL